MEIVNSHTGTVVGTLPGKVQVRITRISGCASCAAKSRCGLSEQKETVITVPTARWQEYHEGDTVSVSVGSGKGLLAVLVAYIFPAVLLLAAFSVCHVCGLSEALCALAALGAVALYLLLLWLIRPRLDPKFQFQLQ